MTQKLSDQWRGRDFPVLVHVARLLDEGRPYVQAHEVADAAGVHVQGAQLALRALVPQYLEGRDAEARMAGGREVIATGLTERGRRTTGLWPSGEGIDALVDALRQAEETTEDPEERSALRKASSAVLGVGRDVMVDVMAAAMAKQMGV